MSAVWTTYDIGNGL